MVGTSAGVSRPDASLPRPSGGRAVSAANRLRQFTHAGGPEMAVAKVDLVKLAQDATESDEPGHIRVNIDPIVRI